MFKLIKNENENSMNISIKTINEVQKSSIALKNYYIKPKIKVKIGNKINKFKKRQRKIDKIINCSTPCKNKIPSKKKKYIVDHELNFFDLMQQPSGITIYTPANFPKKPKVKNIKKFLSQISFSGPKHTSVLLNSVLNPKNINSFLIKRESEFLFQQEGQNFYLFNQLLENSSSKIPKNFLDRHKINPNTRTKMVDWMVEVLSVFKNMDETLFLSINILDLFLFKSKNILKDENIHLIGITAMFIASKFQEIYPITLQNFIVKVSHNKFNENEIIITEKKIIEEISPESLIVVSIYDFINIYFYNFYYYHKKLFNDIEFKVFKCIKKTAVYLSKIIIHYISFYEEICSINAIACIFTAVKIIRSSFERLWNNNINTIFSEWIIFLVSQNNMNLTDIEKIGDCIYLAFKYYQKSNYTSRNLNKFSPLDFIKEINNKKE